MPSNPLKRASDVAEHLIARGCARTATAVATRPLRSSAVCVFLSLALATGFVRIDNEDRPDKLYVPSTMRSQRDRTWIDDRFGDSPARSRALLDARGDTNLLTKGALLEVFDLHDRVVAISAEGGEYGYDGRFCAAAYWETGGARADDAVVCQKASILAFWNYSRAALEADGDIVATVNSKTAYDCCSPTARTADVDRVAARLTRDGDGRVVGARSLALDFYLRGKKHEQTNENPHQARLERKFNDEMRDGPSYAAFDRPMPLTGAGVSDNVGGAFDYDRNFINGAFFVIFTYAFWALYDRGDPYRSRGWLGVCAAFVCVLACLAAFGLALYCGVVFSSTASIAAFLVLGIGLDDAFVIVGAELNHHGDFHDDVAAIVAGEADVDAVAVRRVERAMAAAGPSITVTSITDFCAFVAGSFTAIPAISAFCAFCAAAVAVDFTLQLTLFVAVFSYDMKRKLARAVRETRGPAERKCFCRPDAVGARDGGVNCYGGTYARALLSPAGSAFVLVSTGLLVAFGGFGASKVVANFDYEWFIVDGWYRDCMEYDKKHYGSSGMIWVGLYTGHADYFENADEMEGLLESYGAQRFVLSTSLATNWYSAHAAWASSDPPADSAAYVASLEAFLAEPEGAAYVDRVDVRNGQVVASQIDTLWGSRDSDTTLELNRRMVKARQLARRAAPRLESRVWCPQFIFGEGTRLVFTETIFSMTVACATVAVVLVLLLGDLLAAAFVASVVAAICVCTYGSMHWYGDALNNVSAFFVVIAVGLATDASAHYTHAFLTSLKATPVDRAADALDRLGPSVFKGGASTLLGIALCGFCKTYVFQTFFAYLVTILVLALWFGLAVAPVACRILAPPPRHDAPIGGPKAVEIKSVDEEAKAGPESSLAEVAPEDIGV